MFYWRAVQQLDHRPHQVVGKAGGNAIKGKRKGDRRRNTVAQNDRGGRAVGLQL